MSDEKKAAPEKVAALQKIRDEFKGNDARNQAERLLAALRQFPVTTFEAMRHLDIYFVPARVFYLRKTGHKIITMWQRIRTEAGVEHRVGLYVLQRGAGDA